jgi:hypothetical protein
MTRRILVGFILIIAAQFVAIGQTGSNKASSNASTQRALPQDQQGGITVMQVAYYAKPGKADEVLSHRQHVSDVLEKLGLPRGRAMRRVGGSDEEPDILWECEFPNAAALDHFLKAALANSEFQEGFKYMGALIRKGERRVWQVQESPRPTR